MHGAKVRSESPHEPVAFIAGGCHWCIVWVFGVLDTGLFSLWRVRIMTNIDLITAIEMVHYYRKQLQDSEHYQNYADDPEEAEYHIDHCVESLAEAETTLATLMIELQDGYDFALLPKRRFAPPQEDMDDIPF